jgi:prophage maintenance system killer protein
MKEPNINPVEFAIFKPDDGNVEFQIIIDGESNTVWATEEQIVSLFGKARRTVGEHIKNIYEEGELNKTSTWREFRQVQTEGNRKVSRKLSLYNLDVVISVGYRVKSKTGTQFRIWANKVIKDYLIKGYSINERLLQDRTQQLSELKEFVRLQEKVIAAHKLDTDESIGLINIIAQYTKALDLLDKYDHQRLVIPEEEYREAIRIHYHEARIAINQLGKLTNFEGLFGREKDESFKGTIENIYQTFEGKDLYPTLKEKAAHLLYFVVKNHSFTDGNKRIAAYLFVWFLDKNNILYTPEGKTTIPEGTLVALTLLIAESDPSEKEMMIKLIVNLLATN